MGGCARVQEKRMRRQVYRAEKGCVRSLGVCVEAGCDENKFAVLLSRLMAFLQEERATVLLL